MKLYVVYCMKLSDRHRYWYIDYLEVFSDKEIALKHLKNTESVFDEETQIWSKWYLATKILNESN